MFEAIARPTKSDHCTVVVCGNQNFGSVSVFKKPNDTEPNFICETLFYGYRGVVKTVSDNNSYQTYVPSFHSGQKKNCVVPVTRPTLQNTPDCLF